jgi:hypothetical protein
MRLGLANRVLTKVENAGSKHSISMPFCHTFNQVIKITDTA